MKQLAWLETVLLVLVGVSAAQTYSTLNSGTAENLRGISAVSASVVWASGTHGTYLRTTDSGKTWIVRQVPGAEALDFRDIEAFSPSVAYLLSAGPGEQSRIYKTTDSGGTWILQFTNHQPTGFLDCMAFWDERHGIAVGDPVNQRFELLTTDDGKHWKSLPDASVPEAQSGEGAFAASGTCLQVNGKSNAWFATGGKVARVFRTTDRGQHWSVADTPVLQGSESAGIFSMAFRDSRHGIAVGGDYKSPERGGRNMAWTADGGVHWNLASVMPQSYLSTVAWTSSRVFAGGSTVLAYGDPAARQWTKQWPINTNSITTFHGHVAYAVGPHGSVLRITSP